MKPFTLEGSALLRLSLLAVVCLFPALASAQEQPRRWQRRAAATELPVVVFHSTQSANLTTAETLERGELLFEISHRFSPISGGVDAFWGLDGPVVNRFGLGIGVTDDVFLNLLRSNLADNLELSLKWRFADGGRDTAPWQLAAWGGIAINPEPVAFDAFDEQSLQYMGQLIFNVAPAEGLALGVVPGYLHNTDPLASERTGSASLGTHAQYYLNESASLFFEWIFADGGLEHDIGSWGIEIETGGHFFKLLVSNSDRMNRGQTLAGTRDSFHPDNWRFGFNVTRILSFGG